MSKIHIVSNRLPFSIHKSHNQYHLTPSVGGLATGMSSVYKNYSGNWIGWTGLPFDKLSTDEANDIEQLLHQEGCLAVHLTEDEVNHYYEGFSNNTIWPLFHYFTQYVDHSPKNWEAYKSVNQKFANQALAVAEDGDSIWVHDYQLLLVPEMIKRVKPGVTVGFFLHIPFPSYEVFRILPWREELIKGMLGSDLLGFHIYDYERHFFSCVRRLFGYEISFNQIHAEDRIVVADAFPMGIDYEKFHTTSSNVMQRPLMERSELHRELEKHFLTSPNRQLIISIDRLDYTKGIPNRLRAFRRFLVKYSQYCERVTLVMLAVPSRDKVEHYQLLKKEVDELVGAINGEFGNINYTPIWYFYRSLPFENLVELYHSCDVALITPVRDGMNLVAKEYVASRISNSGVLILSEMTGVAKEMGEAIIINPNNEEEIADSLHKALSMPLQEQKERMGYLQERIKRYTVFKWAEDFVSSLTKVQDIQSAFLAKKITKSIERKIKDSYHQAKQRAIFLDYDGTLTAFHKNPQAATPDAALFKLLNVLLKDDKNLVTIISGRDRGTLENWFTELPINLICEHGVWLKKYGRNWEMLSSANNDWMPNIRPIMEDFVDRTPGSFIEEKNYSLVWHYRKAETELGDLRAKELKDELSGLIGNLNLELMEGSKVIEIKSGGINKGIAAMQYIRNHSYDFIMAIGDDWTDEFMFRELPREAVTIKVGIKNTNAAYNLDSVETVRKFLSQLPVLQ
jgi:trehalose 6-phosphate synthase/phosphatase